MSRERDEQRAAAFFAAFGGDPDNYDRDDALFFAVTTGCKLSGWLKMKLATHLLDLVMRHAPLRDAVLFELRQEQRETNDLEWVQAHRLRKPKEAAGFDTPPGRWETTAQLMSKRYHL